MNCLAKGRQELGLVVCFGEYYDNYGYKVLVSFKREHKLPKELEMLVNETSFGGTETRRASVDIGKSTDLSPRFASRFKSSSSKKYKHLNI
jgi:hypothetical protein